MNELEFVRATADHQGTCQPCQTSTNRVVAFRPKGDPRFDAMFICDSCLEALQNLQTRKPPDA